MPTGGRTLVAWAIAAVLALDGWALATNAATDGDAKVAESALAPQAGSNEPLPAAAPEAAAAPSTTTPPKQAATGGKPAKGPAAPAPAPAPAQPTATTTPDLPHQGVGNFPLEVEVTPQCARRGDKVTIAMKTRPASATTAAVAFSNSEAYGNYTIGTADDQGVWVWRISVPDEAPYGKATVLASASDRRAGPDGEPSTNGEYANTARYFEVKKSC